MLHLPALITIGALIGVWHALQRTEARWERARARILEMDPSMKRCLALAYNAGRRLFTCVVWAGVGAVISGAIWITIISL